MLPSQTLRRALTKGMFSRYAYHLLVPAVGHLYWRQASAAPTPNLQLQSKMMVYDRVVTDLNAARLRETSHPVFHALIEASLSIAIDVMPPLLIPECLLIVHKTAGIPTDDADISHPFKNYR